MNARELLNNAEINPKEGVYLFKYLLNKTEEDLVNNVDLSESEIKTFLNAVNQYKHGKPLQYIIGNVDFYGINLKVNENVLIPRFETEELVFNTINFIKNTFKTKTLKVLDIGTGSGAIAIALKKELLDLEVIATDISKEALKVAKENIKDLDIKLIHGNMLDPIIDKKEKVDIIISNPPYIMENEEIEDIVKNNEPHQALYGGKDGLKYYIEILQNASKVLNEKYLIAFEIGQTQGEQIKQLAKQYLGEINVEIKKDLQVKDRMVFITNIIE